MSNALCSVPCILLDGTLTVAFFSAMRNLEECNGRTLETKSNTSFRKVFVTVRQILCVRKLGGKIFSADYDGLYLSPVLAVLSTNCLEVIHFLKLFPSLDK